jgi:NAD(P)-dependent dehydrogenase (short-subunit alcohol dehydrogenase family)
MAKVAIVTGSSSGIGQSTAQLLAASGWLVLALDLTDPSTPTPGVTHRRCDLADEGAIADAAAAAVALGEVSALVHCAATQTLGAAGEVADADWWRVLAVNLLAIERLVAGTLKPLRTNGGSVVVISSVHAVATTRSMAAYATSKAALEGWVRAAALDLAPEVRVNAIRPGAVDTPMLREGFARRPEDGTVEQAFTKLATAIPLHTVIDPADIARAVELLIDQERPLPMTGSVLTLDAGALLGLSTE